MTEKTKEQVRFSDANIAKHLSHRVPIPGMVRVRPGIPFKDMEKVFKALDETDLEPKVEMFSKTFEDGHVITVFAKSYYEADCQIRKIDAREGKLKKVN